MNSATKDTKVKGKSSGMNISTMIVLMLLSMITNTPGLSAIPLIQMIISKSGTSNIESVIDKNVPKTRKKVQSIPMYEHTCKSHHPHDPKRDACMRARMMAKSNTSNEDDLVVRGSDKGYAHSMDYVGPYSPDVDGNIHGDFDGAPSGFA